MNDIHVFSTLANHLWQSTLFAIVAGLLSLALKNNRAHVRYWLWMAASLKFVVPFSILTALGSYLPQRQIQSIPTPALTFALAAGRINEPVTMDVVVSDSGRDYRALMFAVWCAGSVAVFVGWYLRWRRVAAAIRRAPRLEQGREIEALHRVQSSKANERLIRTIVAMDAIEPGLFGVRHPVLLLPAGIGNRLEPEQLDAIIAHELTHARRHDNLFATFHMTVQALFWFHPLVWWLGNRLVAEREQVCDEEVLRSGHQPGVYARAMLRVCEIYLQSPLACVSGITGTELKKRVVRIMTGKGSTRLTLGRKALLALTGISAMSVPILFGSMHASQSKPSVDSLSFEAAVIKRSTSGEHTGVWGCRGIDGGDKAAPIGRCIARNIPLKFMIALAYRIPYSQINQLISGGPGWLYDEPYDIEATSDPPATESELYRMLQTFLVDQLKLKVYRQEKDIPAFAMTLEAKGLKLHESAGATETGIRAGAGRITAQNVSMSAFAKWLSGNVGRLVVDKTGLAGNYDFDLTWDPGIVEQKKLAENMPDKTASMGELYDPSLFTALKEQLGIKVEAARNQTQTLLIIESAERPKEQ